MSPLAAIAALSVAFVATHLLVSHPPVRAPLIARIGEPGFAIAYSVGTLALYVPLCWLWWTHRHAGAALWVLRSPLAVHLAELVVATGVAFTVAATMSPSPSSVAMRSRGEGKHQVRGLSHVTRHPLFLGLTLIAAGHLVVNGWVGDVWFLGAHAALGVVGAAHQDARLSAADPGYAAYAAEAPFLPNPLGLARIGGRAWLGLGVGLLVAVALRFAHRWF